MSDSNENVFRISDTLDGNWGLIQIRVDLDDYLTHTLNFAYSDYKDYVDTELFDYDRENTKHRIRLQHEKGSNVMDIYGNLEDRWILIDTVDEKSYPTSWKQIHTKVLEFFSIDMESTVMLNHHLNNIIEELEDGELLDDDIRDLVIIKQEIEEKLAKGGK